MDKFYVYLLIDPDTKQPFYVGKGCDGRMYDHHRLRNRLTNLLLKRKLCKLANDGKKIIYEKVLINVCEEDAFKKERTLIAFYGRKIDRTGILCNLTEGGEGNSACRTPEYRKHRSEYMKKQPRRLPIIKRAVSQYSLDGVHICDFDSAKVASENVPGANRSYITQVCKGKRKSAGNFLWTYKGDVAPKFSKQYHKRVMQFSKLGEWINTFRSLTEAQNQTGIELHSISECCRQKSKTAGGFIWMYA